LSESAGMIAGATQNGYYVSSARAAERRDLTSPPCERWASRCINIGRSSFVREELEAEAEAGGENERVEAEIFELSGLEHPIGDIAADVQSTDNRGFQCSAVTIRFMLMSPIHVGPRGESRPDHRNLLDYASAGPAEPMRME
jgi:hypothetical protein